MEKCHSDLSEDSFWSSRGFMVENCRHRLKGIHSRSNMVENEAGALGVPLSKLVKTEKRFLD